MTSVKNEVKQAPHTLAYTLILACEKRSEPLIQPPVLGLMTHGNIGNKHTLFKAAKTVPIC